MKRNERKIIERKIYNLADTINVYMKHLIIFKKDRNFLSIKYKDNHTNKDILFSYSIKINYNKLLFDEILSIDNLTTYKRNIFSKIPYFSFLIENHFRKIKKGNIDENCYIAVFPKLYLNKNIEKSILKIKIVVYKNKYTLIKKIMKKLIKN